MPFQREHRGLVTHGLQIPNGNAMHFKELLMCHGLGFNMQLQLSNLPLLRVFLAEESRVFVRNLLQG